MKPYPLYKDSGVEWIGKIPKHWEEIRLRFIGSFTASGIDKKSVESEVKVKMINYMDIYKNPTSMLDEGRKYMVVTCPIFKADEHKVIKGDLIFTPSSETADEVGFSALVDSELDNTVYSYHVLRFRFTREINHRYKKYLCNNPYVLAQFTQRAKGTTRQILVRNDFNDTVVVLPPLPEQKQIVAFLDHKTAKIDELIEKTERKIELLKEKRTALINHCVTKGLDPEVEMKDSGVEWIGEIPKRWKLVPLMKYIESLIDYRGRTPQKTISGRFLVTTKNIRDGKLDYNNSREYTSESEYQRIMERGRPKFGDLLFTMEAPLGETAVVDDDSIALAQRIVKLRAKSWLLNPFFLKYCILSHIFQYDLQRHATGSTALGLKASKLNYLKILLPLIKEQHQIVEYLDSQTQTIDNIIEKETKRIELLKEYRQALISEVVTGKIDVRKWSEPQINQD